MILSLSASIFASVCIDSVAAILSVYLDPLSLLGLTILVAAFLNSSKRVPKQGTVASHWGKEKPHFDRDIMIADKECCIAGNTGLATTASVLK